MNEAVTWQEAANSCQRMNAHLVTIDDDDERVYLTKLTQALVPLSSFWSDAECSPVSAGLSFSCDALIGYVCESDVSEYNHFKKFGSDKSPLEGSLLSSKTAISSGACSLHCERSAICNSFSYNSETHECKMSSERTDSNAVSENGFDLFILQTTYKECQMHLG
ncbi:uncharacterized protein LOC117114333 [Anneissia japonica]|uniref:uncharacterized protein LOC117114333 n=1 Tax=Anneissia japonica TaxID=1529436 RepID=UPI001425709E|nr:uncharacterized protein LOC117114333 [Anneissia japonica]